MPNKAPFNQFWTSVHALRGLAALLVVIHHIPQYLNSRIPEAPKFEHGAAGVDIFFAISGFVMYATAYKANGDWKSFLISRASRILPLYWFCTLVLGSSALLFPSLFKTFNTNLETLISSLLFLPVYNEEGQIRPLLQMGWTLHYEMLFYGATGVCLVLARRNAAWLSAAILTALAATLSLGGIVLNHTPLILLAPIVSEFMFGVLIAHLATRQHLDSRPASTGLKATAIVGVPVALALIGSSIAAGVSWERVIHWGLGGALLLLAGVIFEPLVRSHLFHLLGGRFLGDVSYALYLTHGFALSIGYKVAKLLGLTSFNVIAAIMIATSLLIGAITHHLIEKKINGLLFRGLTSLRSR